MIKFYTNRELSQDLNINLAKWKRWSREFLPPDPLGGKQSGYARQYNIDDAFTVHLGGYLVTDLKFTIPEAKQILFDLSGWLSENGFCSDIGTRLKTNKGIDGLVKRYQIYILPKSGSPKKFLYVIRGIISDESITIQGHSARRTDYVETILPRRNTRLRHDEMDHLKLLNISGVFSHFLKSLDPT